jgi:hypothetical protein
LKELLARRASTVAEVDKLSRRNVELKRVLNQYLGDPKVNNYMMVPPAQVMKVREVTVPRGQGQAAILGLEDGRSKSPSRPNKSNAATGGAGKAAGAPGGVLKKGGIGAGPGIAANQVHFSKTH